VHKLAARTEPQSVKAECIFGRLLKMQNILLPLEPQLSKKREIIRLL
jgi:hypothetical protein